MKTVFTGLVVIVLILWGCASSEVPEKNSLITKSIYDLDNNGAGKSEENSFISLEKAKKMAKEQKKDIFMVFPGSDQNGEWLRFHNEVLGTEEWQEVSSKKYVVVIIDQPKKNLAPFEERSDDNQKSYKEFGIKNYLTVFILDSNGKPYVQTGYQPGGIEKYLAHLEKFTIRKNKRDELLKKAKDAPKEKRLKLLNNLIERLNKWDVAFAYPEIKEEIVSLDEENKAGLRLKYATDLALFYHSKGNNKKAGSYLTIVENIDANKGKALEIDMKLYTINHDYMQRNNWNEAIDKLNQLMADNPMGESAQKIYYYAGIAYLRLNNKETAIENLGKAVSFAPHSQLAKEINKILAKIS